MKRAFTLIEMLISIAIFSIMFIYLNQAIINATKSNEAYERVYEKRKVAYFVKRVFYNDLFNQADPTKDHTIKKIDKNLYRYCIKTNNSLHGLVLPYVCYRVIDATLYRYESLQKLELKKENMDEFYIDAIAKNVNEFYINTKEASTLIHIKAKEFSSTFEIDLPN